MTPLRFAILEHTTDAGVHHDLLVEDPALHKAQRSQAPLWAARIAPPPSQWAHAGKLELTPLPPHRRRYLTYEGPLSRGRGSVIRLADGAATADDWTDNIKTLRLTIAGTTLTLTITPSPDGRLTARVAASI